MIEINEPATLARVISISSDLKYAYLELRNGSTVTCSSTEPIDLTPGDVILFDSESNIEKAPQDLWPIESWIGIIRLLLFDRVVFDVGGRLRITHRPPHLNLRVGNTVEGNDIDGILAILSESPIRYIDLPAVDEVTIEHFKSTPSTSPSFQDFGGFEDIKARARELITLPLERHDELGRIGARPIKGVLFSGDPGTGKTMLGRIIANEANAQFYLISGPEVLSKWYGQSEELIRKVFEDAANQERAIIFFDELDSLALQRGDNSHEASRRIVGQLLASMDGFTRKANVVVIATTNRPQDIDVALRRPGRFDWEINFYLPSERDREEILVSSARYLGIGEDLPHERVAQQTPGWSPAELASIWSEAALLSVADGRDSLLSEDYLGGLERVAMQRARIGSSAKPIKPQEG